MRIGRSKDGAIKAEIEPFPFVNVLAHGIPRNDFGGFIGMQIHVGNASLIVTELGRYFTEGNINKHLLKVVRKNGYDYIGSEVIVSDGVPGEFTYAQLKKPIILKKNHVYYIVSYEWQNGDIWYNNDSALFFTPDATVDGCVYFGAKWEFQAYPNTSYGPVNFKYTIKE